MAAAKRTNSERQWLTSFRQVVAEIGITQDCVNCGMGMDNRFDCGFDLGGMRRFQFGDLRVALPDRIGILELESAGGVTNLIKYWPLALQPGPPLLLLHVFGQESEQDYIAHLRLWDFTWHQMRDDVQRRGNQRLLARRFVFRKGHDDTMAPSIQAWHATLSRPLDELRVGLFATC